jgi:hypothetical protein
MSLTSTIEAGTQAPPPTQAAPSFAPLTKHIGCEVKGIDLRQPSTAPGSIMRCWCFAIRI